MKTIRIVFMALAVLLPTSWTLAHAGDEAPAPGETKTTTKSKKKKKADGSEETKTEKTEKKAE